MAGWRSDLGLICERRLGIRPGWRAALRALAEADGDTPRNWRDALRLIAAGRGVEAKHWRDALRGIAVSHGYTGNGSWRDCLNFVRARLSEEEGTALEMAFFWQPRPETLM